MYHHIQPASALVVLTLIVVFLVLAAFWAGMQADDQAPRSDQERAVTLVAISVASFFMLVALALFYNLTVYDAGDHIGLKFGIGIISKKIPYREIASVERVRNPWYWGWGIKKIPGGWMWNISGLDAVELTFKNGRKFRIGTNEPEVLAEIIRGKIR